MSPYLQPRANWYAKVVFIIFAPDAISYLLAAVFLGTGNRSSKIDQGSFFFQKPPCRLITFASNSKLEFVPPDQQVSPHLSPTFHYFYTELSSFTQFFIHKNFLIWFYLLIFYFEKFLNLRLMFAVCLIREA